MAFQQGGVSLINQLKALPPFASSIEAYGRGRLPGTLNSPIREELPLYSDFLSQNTDEEKINQVSPVRDLRLKNTPLNSSFFTLQPCNATYAQKLTKEPDVCLNCSSQKELYVLVFTINDSAKMTFLCRTCKQFNKCKYITYDGNNFTLSLIYKDICLGLVSNCKAIIPQRPLSQSNQLKHTKKGKAKVAYKPCDLCV